MASTIKDIAHRTGLGLATISKYLNGGTVRVQNKKLIEEAIAELHYIPNEFARSLKTKQSHTIGVLIPELSNAFITSIITTMEDILRRHDYAVIVCDCRTDAKREAEAVSFLLHKRVDGLINMPTDITGEHLTPMLQHNIPIVLVDRMLQPLSGKVSSIVVDNVDASAKAVQYLVDNGHRNIGIILGNENLFTTQKRLQGYLEVHAQKGIVCNEEHIIYSDYTVQGGYDAIKSLLTQKPPPTAVFITNYEMTLGAMIALNEMQISIPNKLSVIGFDKVDLFGSLYPNLSLVKQPQYAIGECAAKQMLALLNTEEKGINQVITLPTELQEDLSVRKIRG